MLLQGVELPPVRTLTDDPMPAAKIQPQEPPHAQQEQHIFIAPANTAGMATTRLKPILPVPLVTNLPGPAYYTSSTEQFTQGVTLPEQSYTSRTTTWRRKRKLEELEAGAVPSKRKYERKIKYNLCKFCKQPRTAETGHSQYKGHLFCPAKDGNKDHWLKEMRDKFGKRKD